jgi:2-C-methyl-D-erythritol 4-phosphate cytidylyltransferase
MEGVDKVWARLGGFSVVFHSLSSLCPQVQKCVLVLKSESLHRAAVLQDAFPSIVLAEGGIERQDSVERGLEAIGDTEVVAVHDVARPFAPPGLLAAGLACLQDYDGAVPALPLSDTIKQVDDVDRVVATIDRVNLRAVQTPQVFWANQLKSAHRHARHQGLHGTDDAQLLEWAGYRVQTFSGDPRNLKITTDADLKLARLILGQEDTP